MEYCSKINCLKVTIFVAFVVVVYITLYENSVGESIVNFLSNSNISEQELPLKNGSSPSAQNNLSLIPSVNNRNVEVINSSSGQVYLTSPTMKLQLVRAYPFLEETIVNSYPYNYTIYPSKVNCSGRDVVLAVCVPISRTNFDGRKTIRETWGTNPNVLGNQTVLVFFIGSDESIIKSETQQKIEEEAEVFGDILQESYIDTYRNLSLKTVSIVKWFTNFCNRSKYLLKADDDVYINVPVLVRTMTNISESSKNTAFVVGHEYLNNKVGRDKNDKFYTPYSIYKNDTYPRYALGSAYAMTSNAVWLLYEASLRVPLFWIEDIYLTGLCAQKIGVPVLHSSLFSFAHFEAKDCAFWNHIALMSPSSKEKRLIHTHVYDPNTVCKTM